MEMRIPILLLCIAVAVASSKDNSAENTTKVEANSGSGPPSSPPGNETSETGKEHESPKEKSARDGGAEVHRDSGAEKTAGFSSNSDHEGSAETANKAMARIAPNAILKVEIKISKNKSRRKENASSPKGGGPEQEAGVKSDEEKRDSNEKSYTHEEDNGMRNAYSQEKAIPNKRGTVLSSVSYRNGKDTRDGGGVPVKKQTIEVVPCETKKRALTSQPVSAVSPHSMPGNTGRLENFEGGLSVLCILSKNINLIKEKIPHTDSVGRVRDVLVLKNEGDNMRDYWGRLKFRDANGTYIDETGFYEGKLVDSTKELLDSGKLTKNGVYQSKDLPDRDVEKDFEVTKFLLNAISRAKGTSVSDMARENCDLPLVDKLLFARRYAYKEAPKKETVCVCSDSLCKGPCKEIKQIDAKKLD